MAEDVGSLVVRVAMENSSFQQGVQNLNRSLKVIQSEFKNATSGLKDHGKGLDGLKAKQEMLGKSIDVQSKLVEKYKQKLQESRQSLEQAAQKQADLKEKVDEAKAAYEASKTSLGENAEETIRLREEYEALSTEYTRNEERIRNNSRAIDNNIVRVNNAEAQLNSMQRELQETTAEVDRQNSRWHSLSQRLESVGNSFRKVGEKMASIGKEMTAKITAPILALGTGAAKSAIDFESAFAGVRKTVDGTKEQFEQMEKGIREMSKNIPTTAEDIAHVAEAAGQLGIQTDNILGFSKTIIDLGNATNLVGEEGASQLAKFANITSMSQKNFDRLGSTIVALGNNMATTEADIVAMGMRLAGAGHQVGMTESQIMGLSAALSSVGIEAEAGGSAMSKVMVDMQLAVEKGGDSLKDFSKVAGMSSKDFQRTFKKDAAGALIAFIKGLSESEKKGISAIKVLDDMGITEVRMRDALLRAAGAGNLFNKAISIGTEAWKENTALANEANQRYATTESQLKIVKNQIVDSARTIGANLLPVIRDIAKKIAEVTKKFSELSPETQKTIIKFAGVTAAMGPILFIGGKIATVIGGITKAFSTVTAAIAVAKTGAVAATPVIGGLAKAFTVLTGPVGIAIAAIAGIGIAAYEVHKHMSQEAVPAVDLFEKSVQKTTNTIKSANGQIITSYGETTVKISEETKKAVGSYMELDKSATASLTQLYANRTILTKQNSQELQQTYAQMNEQIKNGINKQHQDRMNSLQKFFTTSKTMSATEKTEIIAKEQEHNLKMQASQQEFTDKINAIIKRASNEKRQLTADEVKDIEMYQKDMQENAVNSLSKSEIESKVIMERIKSYNGRMSAEQASEVIKNAETQRVKTVDEANKQFLETKANIEHARDVTGSVSKEQADKMIAEAERQKNQTIDIANMQKSGVVSRLKEQNSEVLSQVDETDGHIKTKWEKLKESVTGKANEIKESVVNSFNDQKNKVSSKCDEIKTSVTTKWNEIINWFGTLPARLKQKAHEMFEAMKKGIDEKMASVKKSATDVGEAIKNAFIELPGKMLNIGHDIMDGLKNGLTNKIGEVKAAAGNVAGSITTKIKGVLDIHSPSRVTKELGQYSSQGLALGILEDMSKVERAATLAAETVRSITEGALSDIKVKSNTNDIEIKDMTGKQLNWGSNNKNVYQEYLDFVNKLNKEEVESSKETLKEDYENRVKYLDERLRILKNENSMELQAERNKVDAQIAYLRKLSRNTTSKEDKKRYANEIADLLLYRKEVLDATKDNQKAQIESLEGSKKALEEYYKDGTKLLDNREKEITKSLKIQENAFKDLMTTYDTAIKTLSIKTGNLIKDLENQEAIVVIQSKKVEDLRKRYEELATAFGATSSETVKAREEFENSRVELEKMATTVKDVAKSLADDINKFQQSIVNALKEKYKIQLELAEDTIQQELKLLEKWKDESLDRINNVYDSKIKAIEESSNAQIQAIENELKAIDEAEKAKDRQEKDQEELKKISNLQDAIKFEHNDYNREQLQKELNKALIEREKRLNKEALEDKKEQLKDRMTAIKENVTKEKEQLEIHKKYELDNINKIYAAEKESYNNRLDELKKFYEEKTKDAIIQAEAEKMIMDKNQKDIVELLHSYSKDYEVAGQTLGERLVEGFRPKIQEIKDMISSINSSISAARDSALQAQSMANSISNTINNNNNSKTSNYTVNVAGNNSSSRDIESTLRRLAFSIA